ncbi:hypothetical protein DPMN_082940 [Dreissena polymorpha]|uniref:Uncharacterized protein n=1 Tax=Dreissena polymorpha TaxID=45954 RepID=A0A9D3Y8E8_DREPO|nr:hypothetical protein DPMN_082940 [Dreissena polymorpha]
MGMKYAEILCKESRWSKATYTYQKAAFLMMCGDQTQESKDHLQFLMRHVYMYSVYEPRSGKMGLNACV